jgi:hypothetical protein
MNQSHKPAAVIAGLVPATPIIMHSGLSNEEGAVPNYRGGRDTPGHDHLNETSHSPTSSFAWFTRRASAAPFR